MLRCVHIIRLSLNKPRGREFMNQENPDTKQQERVPVMQRVLDNPFLLLFIGVVVPTVFYVVWGIMELVSIPLAN